MTIILEILRRWLRLNRRSGGLYNRLIQSQVGSSGVDQGHSVQTRIDLADAADADQTDLSQIAVPPLICSPTLAIDLSLSKTQGERTITPSVPTPLDQGQSFLGSLGIGTLEGLPSAVAVAQHWTDPLPVGFGMPIHPTDRARPALSDNVIIFPGSRRLPSLPQRTES